MILGKGKPSEAHINVGAGSFCPVMTLNIRSVEVSFVPSYVMFVVGRTAGIIIIIITDHHGITVKYSIRVEYSGGYPFGFAIIINNYMPRESPKEINPLCHNHCMTNDKYKNCYKGPDYVHVEYCQDRLWTDHEGMEVTDWRWHAWPSRSYQCHGTTLISYKVAMYVHTHTPAVIYAETFLAS